MGSLSLFHLVLLAVFVLIPLYLLPSIIVIVRRHPQRIAIIALNVLLGWSLLGWVGALVWALAAPSVRDAGAAIPAAMSPQAEGERRACPECGERIMVVAKVCRFCGSRFAE